MRRKIPTEMAIKPETRKNFLPIGNFGLNFRLGSCSFSGFTVLTVFNVFWDIPFIFCRAKVNNLPRFPFIGKITALTGLFFIFNFDIIFAQTTNRISAYQLKYRHIESDSGFIFFEFSDPAEIKYFLNQKLKFQLNNGYPFSQISFDTIYYNNKSVIKASLNSGPFIVNGDLVNHGDTSLKVHLISKFLRIRKNYPFSDEKQKKLLFQLQQIPFAESIESPKLEFFGNQSIVHLNLVKRKSNYFTGILGLLPQSETEGGTIVTGNIDGSLNNLFGQGIQFFVKWNRFAPASQMADIKLIAPVLNYNGLGFESDFELFRQDSTVNRQKLDLRISSSPGGVWKFQFGYVTSRSSGLLALSGNNKVKIETNSISFSILNSPFQPPGINLKKRAFQLSLFPTIKKIQKEAEPKSFPQLSWDLNWRYPISFNSQRFAVQTFTRFSGIASKEITLQEQLRAGGNQSTRGFNENIFFLSQLAAFSIQPQYLVDKSLMVGVFTDFLVFNPGLNNMFFSKPSKALGFGVSVELDFGSNSVQLSIANGIVSGIPLDLQTTKIHFGYVARF